MLMIRLVLSLYGVPVITTKPLTEVEAAARAKAWATYFNHPDRYTVHAEAA